MYLFYDESNRVNLIYHMDLPDDLKSEKYFEVDELPEPEEKQGFRSVLKCDGERVWYEYVERELTELEELKQAIETLIGGEK